MAAQNKVKVASVRGDVISVNVAGTVINVRALKRAGSGKSFFLYIEQQNKFQIEYETDSQTLRFYPYYSDGAEFNSIPELSKYVRAIKAAAVHTSNHGLSGTRSRNLSELEG